MSHASTIAGASQVPTTPLMLVPIGESSIQPFNLSVSRPTLIGRQSHCDIQLTDQSVSREHCAIESRRGRWFVTDRTSRMGTLLNGARLEPNLPTQLDHGDLIGIARWSFRVQLGSAAPLPMPGTAQRMAESDGRVQTMKAEQVLGRAERQLGLIINMAQSLHAAPDEQALAAVVVRAAAEGTGFRRAAYIKTGHSADTVSILAAVEGGIDAPRGFPISRTLVRAAMNGEVATLMSDVVLRHAVSIIDAGVRSAICAPIIVAANPVAFLYVDNADRDAPAQIDGTPFIAAVAHFAALAMAEQARRNLDERNQRLAADMTAARHAQERLMPAPRGSIGPVHFAFRNKPGRLVAGDLADVIDLGNGRVAACLGDVSGKGVGAAMLMAAAQTQMRALLRDEPDLGRAIIKLNREVVSRLVSGEFISLWVGVIDSVRHTLTYLDAGHGYWIHRSKGSLIRGPQPQFMPLGIEAEEAYEASTILLNPGDRITALSDGVAEQHGAANDAFRMEGIENVLRVTTDENQDVHNLLSALEEFAGTDALADDVTVLSMRFGG